MTSHKRPPVYKQAYVPDSLPRWMVRICFAERASLLCVCFESLLDSLRDQTNENKVSAQASYGRLSRWLWPNTWAEGGKKK